ncbi:hypothetical protein [Mycobacterium lepromatosis]|uniref:hypothetical protein n=1 Tax=Mycobacterium lepromatosis TaxID=480418 RepID=UPI002351CF7C|nr:hypothetical protein [Mycobacterium lepromatosis]
MLDPSGVTKRKQLSDKISVRRNRLEQRRVNEERRLLYVRTIRVEDTLLVFGHDGVPWGSSRAVRRFSCAHSRTLSAAAGDPLRGGLTVGTCA